jgi:glycosyltransferase involved in cell wall biosynthesis
MTSLSSILRRPGRPPLRKVVFVCYGPFDCNSAGHIAGFAAELSRQGLAVAVCARDEALSSYAFGPPTFEPFALAELSRDPKGVVGFDGALDPAASMLVCWTPRKASRRPVQKASRALAIPYVVHFEDNEDHLSELRFVGDAAAAARDFGERAELMAGASGVTFIAPRLEEVLPPVLPKLLLEPGVDHDLFGAPLAPLRRSSLLRALGVAPGAAVLVYPGNVHRANAGEMAELYRALALLRDRGRAISLIKTGKDDAGLAAAPGFDPAQAGVIDAGQVDRAVLVDLLKCADLFVQPGAPGPFNDYRLPSKLPEFMAVGRPVVLPRANVGLRLQDGEQALLLETGSADEIAAAVERILDDAALGRRLASGAQAFARRTWRWDRQGKKLLAFLERLRR